MISRMSAVVAAICSLVPFVFASSTVYLIRHGEKVGAGDGLNATGLDRAQCLVNVFGGAPWNIGYILAEHPKKSGSRQRPLDTVRPLANKLGLTVDTHCDRDDSSCVNDAVRSYRGPGNILICWEHGQLTNIVQALGDQNAPEYPDDRFDLIWTSPPPYNSITSEESECCPGIDRC